MCIHAVCRHVIISCWVLCHKVVAVLCWISSDVVAMLIGYTMRAFFLCHLGCAVTLKLSLHTVIAVVFLFSWSLWVQINKIVIFSCLACRGDRLQYWLFLVFVFDAIYIGVCVEFFMDRLSCDGWVFCIAMIYTISFWVQISPSYLSARFKQGCLSNFVWMLVKKSA